MCTSFQRILSVISSPPLLRRGSAIDHVLPWLRKQSDLLKNLDNAVLTSLVKNCDYIRYKKDDVIIEQGDIGNSFYIMLSGQTSVYIDPSKSGEEQELHTENQSVDQEEEEQELSDPEMDKSKKRSKYGKHIGTYDAGKSFGEIALISKDAVRNATIIADEDTDIMAIDRDTYGETLKSKQEEDYLEQSAFVNSCPMFQTWNNKFKKLLEMSIRKVVLPFGAAIVKQGDPVVGLHFMIKGEAKILVDTSTHKSQYPKLYDPSNTALARELGKVFVKKEERKKEGLQQEQVRVRRRDGYVAAEKRLAKKVVTLCVVDESEIVGDSEIALGLETYAQSVVCTANTELFLLDNKNIERFIYKKYTSTVDFLRGKVLSKLTARSKSKLGTEVELYQHMIDALEEFKPKRSSVENDAAETGLKYSNKDSDSSKANDLNQLVELYLQNRAPLINPHVPGTIYYKAKAVQKARKRMMDRLRKYESNKKITPQVRLDRARRAAKRQPRSRRELERLTVAQDPEELSRLYDKNHAVNRFLSQRSTSQAQPGNTKPRPHTATGTTTRNAYEANSSIFQLTEPQVSDECNVHDVDYSDLQEEEIRQIVQDMGELHDNRNASRARVICSMMDKSNNSQSMGLIGGLRPKSAPIVRGGHAFSRNNTEIEESEDTFDFETSDRTLNALEVKLKAFYNKYEGEGRRNGPSVQQLKRFVITKPDDVPIPGGTVFVRQKECKFPASTNATATQHQHVRRFIIPKDAVTIASKALSTIETHQDNSSPISNGYKTKQKSDMNGIRRPKTASRSLSQASLCN